MIICGDLRKKNASIVSTDPFLNGWTESIGYDSSVRPNVFTSSAGTFTYTFNGAGTRLNTLALPGSSTVSYGYNARGDLNLIALARSGATLDTRGYEISSWELTRPAFKG